MFGKEKVTINAILDSEIESILKQTNHFESFINGEYHCENCGVIINTQNIGIIQPLNEEDEIKLSFYCERVDCIEKYHMKYGKQH